VRNPYLDDAETDEFYARKTSNEFPFMTLRTSSMMELLGIEADLAMNLVK
jgi:hypothetical protein